MLEWVQKYCKVRTTFVDMFGPTVLLFDSCIGYFKSRQFSEFGVCSGKLRLLTVIIKEN